MTTMDDQDSPLPTSVQLEQVFGLRVHDPLPFFNPSASNLSRPASGSLDGEADSSSSSGVSYHGLSQQELPSMMLNSIFRNPNLQRDFQPPVPMTTIDDDPTYQDSPLPTPYQLAQLLLHLEVLDTSPFFDPSSPNVPLVSSIYGETDSSSGVCFRRESSEDTPSQLLNTYWNPHFWANRPPTWCYKLNVAVSLCSNGGNRFLGVAAVLRDHEAYVHRLFTKVWRDSVNPIHVAIQEAELDAFNKAIESCTTGGYRVVFAETESLWLVRRIRELFDDHDFEYYDVRHISITDNVLAHRFAPYAIHYDGVFWTMQQIDQVFGTLRLPF
ncbi:hypothetical protein L6164_028827 [Bauhinia variegata]|uniref:Uncharacterized protein n=1 Tax=Bauhinia variegata TaxID=167791 RepID=A0ACB9L757_BAUVA|nr:hypothetical protein L6164_028827 [Bauhinia variegata]